VQNYNNSTIGLNFSVSYPLPRHNFQRVGFTYSADSVEYFGLQYGLAESLPDHQLPLRHSRPECPRWHHQQLCLLQLQLQHHQQSAAPAQRQRVLRRRSVAGIGGNVRYYFPAIAYKQFMP